MSQQNSIVGQIAPYAGGLVRVGSASASIDSQGNFSIPVNSNPATQTIVLTPPLGTAYSPLSLSVTLTPGGTNITAQIEGALTVVGTFVGIPSTAVVATDPHGFAIPGSGGGGGVSQIVAGTNVTISPSGGTGAVTVNATGGGSSITLKTNGTNNGSQTTLNLAAGSNVGLVDNGTGTVTISAQVNTATDKYLGVAPYLAITGDWSVAINQAMTDLAANGLNGGNIHGNGVYNCNGTPLDPTGGNAILLAPVIPSVAGETVCVINFIGDVPTIPTAVNMAGMTFASTNNTSGVNLFGAYSATSWQGHVTAVKVVFNHVNFILTGTLPNALNGLWLNALECHDVLMIGGGRPSTSVGGTGLITPSISNNFEIVMDRVGVFNFTLGALIHEHTQLDNFSASNNYNGIQFDAQDTSGNSIGGSNIWMQNNTNYLLGPPGANLTRVQLSRVDFESDPGTGFDILDPNSSLVGYIAYSKQSPATSGTFSGVGPALAIFNLRTGQFDSTILAAGLETTTAQGVFIDGFHRIQFYSNPNPGPSAVVFHDLNDVNYPFILRTDATGQLKGFEIPSDAVYGMGSTSSGGAGIDTAITRISANVMGVGNGGPGDASGRLECASITHTIIYSAAGTPLPSASTPLKGTRAVVSDATAPTFLGTYISGGTVVSPVLCNGTAWVTA